MIIGSATANIDDNLKKADDANDAAAVANNGVKDINSDNKLTPNEKLSLKRLYDSDVLKHDFDVKQLTSMSLPTVDIDLALSNLTTFTAHYFANMSITETVDRQALNKVFNDFENADKAVEGLFNDAVQQVADDAKKAGDDAKEAGEKAQEAGEEAKASADQAKTDATQAKADAATAQQKAQSSIDQFNAHLPDIDEALSTANLVKQSVTKLSDTTEQYHNEYTTGIQNIVKTIDEASVGGTNLVPNSGMMQDTKGWNTTGTLVVTKHALYHNGQVPIFRLSNNTGSATSETLANNVVRFNVKRNTNYTMSVITFATSNTVDIDLYFLGRAYGSTNDFDKSVITVAKRKVSSTEADYVTATFNTGDSDEGYFRIDNNGTTDGKESDVYFTEVKVEEGTKATPWSPATTDLATATEFDQLSDALRLTAKQTDMDKALNSIATFTETANGLQTQVNSKAGQSQVTQLADQYQAVVGSMAGSSLVPNSGYPIDTNHWTIGGVAKGIFNAVTHGFYHNSKDNVFVLRNQGGQLTSECYVSSDRFPVKPNTQYSLSFKGFASSNVPSMDVWFLGRKYSSTSSAGYDQAVLIVDKKVLSTLQVDTVQAVFNTGDCEEGYIRFDNNGSSDGNVSSLYFTEVQVNVGTIAMPWAAPTLSQSDITASINNIHLGVKNADGSASTFNMNSNTILLDANKIIFNGKTSIQNGTIGTAKIADAAINTAQIADGAINNAKIANASINDAKISNLNGNKIIAGSITAQQLNADDIIANVINGKTINGITITTPNLQLGTNGILSEDWSLNQATSLFNPKKGSGTMTLTQGLLATSGTLSRWWSNDGGYWYGIGDDGSKIKNGSNQVGDNYGAGYAQHNIFDSKGNTLLRTYMDATGLYMNSGGTSNVNTVLTQQGLTTANVTALGDINGATLTTSSWVEAGIGSGNGIRIGFRTIQSHNTQDLYFNGDDNNQSVTLHAKSIIQSSQLSRKKDIKPLDPDYAMKVIRNSDMYGYRYNEESSTEPLHYSGIIDDVNGTPHFKMPAEFISGDRTGRNDGNTVAFLVEALKQADKRIGILEGMMNRD
ncbi:hypothetical protein [Pediococcus pentosaceus]|uniref:hypothetical protein n=1 Tax=Pediococcus pentosaceus TaxID=1255 RepID=UPI00263B7889|nr:hypothetical protein [Pediococcus pentosaceus]MDN4853847.1 hypothetical protein [Pediococcus pentosaceus]